MLRAISCMPNDPPSLPVTPLIAPPPRPPSCILTPSAPTATPRTQVSLVSYSPPVSVPFSKFNSLSRSRIFLCVSLSLNLFPNPFFSPYEPTVISDTPFKFEISVFFSQLYFDLTYKFLYIYKPKTIDIEYFVI